MASSKPLFTIPIPALGSHKGGSIVCTVCASRVYLLTWFSPPDNRLTPVFLDALLLALDVLEFKYPPGVVVTTSAITKFYSNGVDLSIPMRDQLFWEKHFYPVLSRILTYPMPTVALINGHAFAGGIMLAMHHDYRVFNGDKGYLCVNELQFGAPIPPPLTQIFRTKISGRAYRKVVLEAHRFNAKDALEFELVDAIGGLDAALELIEKLALYDKGNTAVYGPIAQRKDSRGVYGLLKQEMYRDQITLLESTTVHTWDFAKTMAAEEKRKEEGKKRIEKWDKGFEKGKL